jgi:hypothetical protein
VKQVHVTERSELGRLAVAAGAVVVTMAGVVLAMTLVVAPAGPMVAAPPSTPGTPVPLPAANALVLPPSRPIGLDIPAIGVHAGAEVELDLTPGGVMEVPSAAASVGWFAGGPTPGEVGTAILAGHTDYGYLRGAFYRLREVGVGDVISVPRDDGKTAVFTTFRRDIYPPGTRPDLAATEAGIAELRLMTCQGDYDGAARGTTVVVSAKLSHVS